LNIKLMLFRSLRSKSGMSTILGVLFFVGILFTCVIPLFIYVNKLNSYYYRAMTETREFDQDKESERIDVYAYPTSQSGLLNIYIKNKSPLPVKIIRIWINDNLNNRTCKIPGMVGQTIESVNISDMLPTDPGNSSSFNIKVMTATGNSIASLTNTLYYTAGETQGEGDWAGGMGFTIQVVIETPQEGTRFFHINITGPSEFTYEADVVKRPHESSCFAVVTVTEAGEYNIEVKEGTNPLIVTPNPVTLDQNMRSQWVYARPAPS